MRFILFSLTVLFLQSSFTTFGKTPNLHLEITGISKVEGQMMVAIYDHEDAYRKSELNQAVKAKAVPVNTHKMILKLNLPYGNYGIVVYHDENQNGELDTNFFGIPKERYGFSNNARGRFGPPSFEEIVFNFNPNQTRHSIELK